MNEYDTINAVAARFRRSPDQLNSLFESDAEFVRIGGQVWGLTIDEFTPAEDLFTSDDPGRLGANLVAATLSDLLAAGVEPRFFLHALGLPRNCDPEFARRLCDGMAAALDRADCALCGGDTGVADPWRCTGFAMGPLAAPAPITRRLPPVEQNLWVTGALGDFNMAALQKAPTPELELRMAEAEAARGAALAGIDTSGGLADALWMMHRASPGVSIEVDTAAIPYAAGVREACAAAGIPPEASLFGGAGEYELLFSFDAGPAGGLPDRLAAAGSGMISSSHSGLAPCRLVRQGPEIGAERHAFPLQSPVPATQGRGGRCQNANCWRMIGRAFPSERGGVTFILRDGRRSRMRGPPPCPRSAAGPEEHALQAIGAAVNMLGEKSGL